ncbi:CGNR zinc finger domain-containing protein [Reyranella sp.]|uniref:CGNR zinc finger domain-containing protein n=1 Tax=Reyranella sp. TaxID=1929291 RepID=UPI003BAD04B8
MARPDLCLDFANTRYWRGQAIPTETLNGADALAAWTVANVTREARPLARREFERALEARETIYRVFDATARGKAPAAADLQALNDLLAAAPSRTTLRRERGGFSWDVDLRGGTALGQLAPVLWTAGDLLTGNRLDRVRRCANPECGWLFLDDSRAGKRRWCSMSACGNRAKARRHYHKSKEEA